MAVQTQQGSPAVLTRPLQQGCSTSLTACSRANIHCKARLCISHSVHEVNIQHKQCSLCSMINLLTKHDPHSIQSTLHVIMCGIVNIASFQGIYSALPCKAVNSKFSFNKVDLHRICCVGCSLLNTHFKAQLQLQSPAAACMHGIDR